MKEYIIEVPVEIKVKHRVKVQANSSLEAKEKAIDYVDSQMYDIINGEGISRDISVGSWLDDGVMDVTTWGGTYYELEDV